MTMDIPFLTATEMAARIRDGSLTSLAALEALLEQLDRINPQVNAVVVIDRKSARQRAAEADAALARGEILGPLHGVPMTVKESYDVTGMPTTWGVPRFIDRIANANAAVVQSLENAGAIVYGKTNVPYLLGDWQSFNDIYGTTNNPWDLSRGPGGSSGGAAASLACGFTPLEIGSDSGASIRNPAHYCGVFGHRPSFGIVPQTGHWIPGAREPLDLLVCGPMARSADDLIMVLDILAGPADEDGKAWKLELPPPRAGTMKDLRVAVLLETADYPVDATVRDMIRQAGERAEALGAKVDWNARPELDLTEGFMTFIRLLRSATGAVITDAEYFELVEDARLYPDFSSSYRARAAIASTLSHREHQQAAEVRRTYRAGWAAFFKSYDVLLCPIAPTTAMPHDQDRPRYERTVMVDGTQQPVTDAMFWASLSSLSCLPATVAPVGLASDGLPVGVQIVGPYLEDKTTLEFARLLTEGVAPLRPPIAMKRAQAPAQA